MEIPARCASSEAATKYASLRMALMSGTALLEFETRDDLLEFRAVIFHDQQSDRKEIPVRREPDLDRVVARLALFDEAQSVQFAQRRVDQFGSREMIAVKLDLLAVGHMEREVTELLSRQKHELIHQRNAVLRVLRQHDGFVAAVESQMQLLRPPVERRAHVLARIVEPPVVESLGAQSRRRHPAAAGGFDPG